MSVADTLLALSCPHQPHAKVPLVGHEKVKLLEQAGQVGAVSAAAIGQRRMAARLALVL
jgi:hypothetical protein